jgi:acyl-CoA thioesterase FadM
MEGGLVFPWLRLFRVVVPSIFQSKVPLPATTCVRMRVWPNDLDFNLHLNNGRYLALADIARIHWFTRAGLLAVARRYEAYPVVGDVTAKFRRDLRAFQSFEIHTRLIGWDSKWGFLEHRFVRAGRVIAVVTIRGVFKGPSGPVEPSVLVQGVAHPGPTPEMPEWADLFHQSSDRLSEVLREEERAQGLRGARE